MSDIHDDARRMTDAVLKRDRRRIRTLAVLTIGLWVLAVLLIASVYLPIGAKLKQFAIMVNDANPGFAAAMPRGNMEPPPPAPISADQVPLVLARVQRDGWIVSQIVVHEWIVGAIILTLALLTGLLASVAGVALALTIRRGTLRQVSASLAEISEQLRQLKTGP